MRRVGRLGGGLVGWFGEMVGGKRGEDEEERGLGGEEEEEEREERGREEIFSPTHMYVQLKY